MTRPVSSPSTRELSSAFRGLLPLLFLGVLFFGACDLDYPTANWADQSYDHEELSGGYALAGPHIGAACDGCHSSGNFELLYAPDTNQDCVACHTADFQAQHAGTGYPETCLTCHNGSVWPRSEFNHGTASGGFTLSGAHATLNCTKCHYPDTFAPRYSPASPGDCSACHG